MSSKRVPFILPLLSPSCSSPSLSASLLLCDWGSRWWAVKNKPQGLKTRLEPFHCHHQYYEFFLLALGSLGQGVTHCSHVMSLFIYCTSSHFRSSVVNHLLPDTEDSHGRVYIHRFIGYGPFAMLTTTEDTLLACLTSSAHSSVLPAQCPTAHFS